MGILTLIGLSGGFLSGLLGIGGGIIFVPMLVLLLNLPQKQAQGATLLIITVISLIGVLTYGIEGVSIMIESHMILIGVLCGAVVGSLLVNRLQPLLLKKMFSLYFIVVGIRMLME